MIEFQHEGMTVAALYDRRTGSFQYVVADDRSRMAAIIDPVLDYDPRSSKVWTENADLLLAYVRRKQLEVCWVLDTHPHADHFSAAPYISGKVGAPTGIGEKVVEVQKLWSKIYCLPEFPADGRQWDHLFTDGETFNIGSLAARVMFTPGHTMASVAFIVNDAAFVHDTLMVPDSGTSRADFPGGNAHALFSSIRRILDLPETTVTYVGHDYERGGREASCCATVAQQRSANIHVRDGVDANEFVEVRTTRDSTLPFPDLMLAALQVNIRGGRLPDPHGCGTSFLTIPVNAFGAP